MVVESKYKGGDSRSEDCPVGHAGGVALPLLQEVHWVEDQGQGDDVEDHVINQVPDKSIIITSESDIVTLPCDTHTAILIVHKGVYVEQVFPPSSSTCLNIYCKEGKKHDNYTSEAEFTLLHEVP